MPRRGDRGGRWRFKDLPKGKYDLVILAKGWLRIEGFQFAVREFDPFFPAAAAVDEETSREISGQHQDLAALREQSPAAVLRRRQAGGPRWSC